MVKKRTHIGDQEGLKLADNDELISQEEVEWRLNEAKRCKDSILYFANNYFYVLNPYGDKIKIKVYKKQGEFLEKLQKNNRLVTLQSRQSGKTTSYVIFCLYQILFQKNYKILIAANTLDTAMGNLAKIKEGFEDLPNWMKPCITKWSATKIEFDNGCSIKVSATTASSGRSSSIDLLILDEFAFVEKNIQEEFWRASLPTVSARPLAKIVIVSTPNGAGDKFHFVWNLATSGKDDGVSGSVWVPHRIDWWERPDRDEAWHQRELKSLGSEEAFQQEYGNRFTISSGDKLITDDKIIKLKEYAEKSNAVISVLPVNPRNPDDKLTYTRYFEYEEDHTYVAGIDCAEGTGQDSSVMYIFDITHTDDIMLVAKFDSTKTIPEEFANVIYRLWMKYGKPKIMIETNSCGLAVLEALKNLSRAQNDKLRFEMNSIVKYNRPAGHTGINSNNQSKSKSMLNLQNLIQSNRYRFVLPDDELFRELPFCEKRSGSGNVTYRALKGHHDDHILAMVWGLFILSQELIEKYFTVEYAIDEDTEQKYPVLILPIGEDIESYKNEHKDGIEMGVEEAIELAAKWRMLGDEARASFILQMVYDRETEDTGGNWGRNPFQIDQSLFSDKFREKFFDGKYSDGYFRQSISDPNEQYIEDNYGFGWVM